MYTRCLVSRRLGFGRAEATRADPPDWSAYASGPIPRPPDIRSRIKKIELYSQSSRKSSVCTLWPCGQPQFAHVRSSVQAEEDKCGRPGQNSNDLQDEPERSVKNDHSDNDQYD